MRQRPSKIWTALAAALIYTAKTGAAEYSAGMAFDVSASHNDNIRFTQNDKTSVQKYDVAPTFTLGSTTEVSQIRLNSTFDFNRYDKSEFDSNDQNIRLSMDRQFESSSIGLDAAYINNSTITSELLTTGRIGNKAERAEQYQLSPRWLYNFNEANLLQLQASYTTQDYRSDEYTGYENTGAQVSWIHRLSERMSWVTTGTYSDYQSDDIELDVPRVDTLTLALSQSPPFQVYPAGYFGQQSYSVRTKNTGLNLGVKYDWSELSSIEASLGRSKNHTMYPVKDSGICSNPEYITAESNAELIGRTLGAICTPLEDSNKFSSTADITWQWKNEQHQISLTGTKETQPTSNGYTIDAIQIGSNWTYKLTELDQLSASMTLVRNRATDDKSTLQNASLADRDYGTVTVAYRRQLDEQWFVRTSYQYSKQKYDQRDVEATSNVWALSINYQPQPWRWSR
ncbi:MAG: hypothetical protein QM709_13465 [Spongiibacteraceae bacterium]